jgi:hypothetical protein
MREVQSAREITATQIVGYVVPQESKNATFAQSDNVLKIWIDLSP